MSNTVDGMNICNCGFEFQNATCVDNVKQYKIWLDDLSMYFSCRNGLSYKANSNAKYS